MENLENIKEIGSRFSRGILKCLEIIQQYNIPDLSYIILFGSCARGKMVGSSDIDIAIVTRRSFDDDVIRGRISGRFELLPEDLDADVVFLDEETYLYGQRMLHQDIRMDGVILWKEGEFTNVYKQLLINSKK